MAVRVPAFLTCKVGGRVMFTLVAGSANSQSVIMRRLLLPEKASKVVETCKRAGRGPPWPV